jgi:hypothetical protein
MKKSEAGAVQPELDERTQAADVDALFAPNTANPSQRLQATPARSRTGESQISNHPSSPTGEDTHAAGPGSVPAVGTRIQHY